jgi:hypothetical protein
MDYFRSTHLGENGLGALGGFGDEDEENDLMENKLKEANYYKYHENVQEYDPRGQPYSYFYITCMG